MTAPSSAFGPSRLTPRFGTPGVGDDPLSGVPKPGYMQMSLGDLLTGTSQVVGQQEPTTVPAAPSQQPGQPVPTQQQTPQLLQQPASPGGQATYGTLGIEDIMSGTGKPYIPYSWPEAQPFARQKRALKALGAEGAIVELDEWMADMMTLSKNDRAKRFKRETDFLENIGVTPDESDELRQHFGILGVEPQYNFLEKLGMQEIKKAEQQRAIASGLGEIYGSAMERLGESKVMLRNAVYKSMAKARRSGDHSISVEMGKDIIRARNWQRMNEQALFGDFPTMDELGEEFIAEQMTQIKGELKHEGKSRAVRTMINKATSLPSSSAFRRGKIRPIVPAEFIVEHPILRWPAMTLAAPAEILADVATDPRQWPQVTVGVAAGHYVIGPATSKFFQWAGTKGWAHIDLRHPFRDIKKYRNIAKAVKLIKKGTRPVPITKEDAGKFLWNVMQDPKFRVPYDPNMPYDAEAVVTFLEKAFPDMDTKAAFWIGQFLKENPKSGVHILVPKDPNALNTLINFVGERPTAAGPTGLLTPPPVPSIPTGQALGGVAGAAEVAGAGLGAALTDSQLAAAAVATQRGIRGVVGQMPGVSPEEAAMGEVIAEGGQPMPQAIQAEKVAARSGIDPDEVIFLRNMGVSDQEIVARSDNLRIGIDTAKPPDLGDRVIIPSLGHKAGKVVDNSNPARVEVLLDGAERAPRRLRLGEDQLIREEAFKFQQHLKPMDMSSDIEELEYRRMLEAGDQLDDAAKARHPMMIEQVEGEAEARRVLTKAKRDKALEHKAEAAEAKQVTPGNPIPPARKVEAAPAEEPEIAAAIETALGVTPAKPAPTPPVPVTPAAPPAEAVTPVEWSMPDGRPIYQVPLNEFLLQGVPPEVQSIKDLRINQMGFGNVATREGDQYVKAVGRVVRQHLPEELENFRELAARHQKFPGSVPVSKFDQILSGHHKATARMTFRREMEVTGLNDAEEAALTVHRGAVQQALTEGKTVPEPVLDQYPDLKRTLTNKSQLVSRSRQEMNTELTARGYTESQLRTMNDLSREWIIENDIDPRSISVLPNGQAVEIPPVDRPINDPSAFDGATESTDIPVEMFEDELDIADILKNIRLQDEEGLMQIPGADAIVKLRALLSRLNERLRNSAQDVDKDLVRSVSGAIDKYVADVKMAHLAGYYAEQTTRKLVERGIYKAWRTKKPRYKTPAAELDIVTRWIDEPEFFQAEFDKLSDPAKKLAEYLKADYDEKWRIANQAGILETYVDNYINRIYKDNLEVVARKQYGTTTKNLQAKAPFAKKRKYPTLRQAFAAGLHPITDPIKLHRLYTEQLAMTIARNNLLRALMNLRTKDGYPAVMKKPPAGDPMTAIFERQYQRLGVDGFERWVVVKSIKGKPAFVKLPARAHPEVAKAVQDVFGSGVPDNKFYRGFLHVKSFAMRLKMMNFMIHGWNILSDQLTEFNFNPFKLGKALKNNYRKFKAMDQSVVEYVQSGLDLQIGKHAGWDIGQMLRTQDTAVQEFFNPAKYTSKPAKLASMVPYGVSRLLQGSDHLLWGGVRYAQLSMAELMTQKILESNKARIEKAIAKGKTPPEELTRQQAMKAASYYTNLNVGTFPRHWLKPWLNRLLHFLLFAKRWTVTNLGMIVTAISGGKFGIGLKGMGAAQRTEIAYHLRWHLLKNISALVIMTNTMQMGAQVGHNMAIDMGLHDGEKVPVRPTFMNGRRHWWDVWAGQDNRGQNRYLVIGLYRWLRDYVGWLTDPRQTALNKMDMFTRAGVETMFNYQSWIEKPIYPRGAPAKDKILMGMRYFSELVTPSGLYAKRPGREPQAVDWIVPWTGQWLRRGTPGGKMGKLYHDYLDWKKYSQGKLDNQIDEAIDRQDWDKVAELAPERWVEPQEAVERSLIKRTLPVYHIINQMGPREMINFMTWLEEENRGFLKRDYTEQDMINAIEWEVNNLIKQKQEDYKQNTPEYEDTKQEIQKELRRREGKMSLEDILAPHQQQLQEAR